MAGGYQQQQGYTPYKTQKRDAEEDGEGRKLFVGGLAWDSDEESIKTYFEQFGSVEAVNLKRNKEDMTRHRGFAFVKFVNAEDAETVLMQKEPHLIDGSKVDPKSACPIGIKPEHRTKKIFIGGLQEKTTEERLMEYFGEYGEIQNDIEFNVDPTTKKRRGFCFIEFGNEVIVDRIVKEKYHQVAGVRLETKRALSKHQQAEAAAATHSDNRGRYPAVTSMGYGVQQTLSPYGQPVIYIHPDTLSTTYPMSMLGLQGLSGSSGVGGGIAGGSGGYASSLETLYNPYSGGRDTTTRQPLYPGYWRFYPPTAKSYPSKPS